MIQINNKYNKLKIFINHYDSEKTQLLITLVSNFTCLYFEMKPI